MDMADRGIPGGIVAVARSTAAAALAVAVEALVRRWRAVGAVTVADWTVAYESYQGSAAMFTTDRGDVWRRSAAAAVAVVAAAACARWRGEAATARGDRAERGDGRLAAVAEAVRVGGADARGRVLGPALTSVLARASRPL